MLSRKKEKEAFKVLCDADVGAGHDSRCFQLTLTTYDALPYSAYISGFKGPEFYGWVCGNNPMEQVF